MGIREQLEQDMREAMRARDQHRLAAVRLLRAAISNLEIARTDRKHAEYGQPVTEEDIQRLVQRDVNQRREALAFAEQAGRQDLVEKERTELAVVESYLPRQLSRDEIRAAVEALIAEQGREFRKVMPLAAQRLRGRADGRLVNEVVRELTA
ncbi:MAG TPA: GatB/YqeY domain-containing protein [Chloroflexota bacterium]|jgi:uncharacterized protein YqeY|nr:GatB/YqeY domain-containing protein [Chloroflexota bacterium]